MSQNDNILSTDAFSQPPIIPTARAPSPDITDILEKTLDAQRANQLVRESMRGAKKEEQKQTSVTSERTTNEHVVGEKTDSEPKDKKENSKKPNIEEPKNKIKPQPPVVDFSTLLSEYNKIRFDVVKTSVMNIMQQITEKLTTFGKFPFTIVIPENVRTCEVNTIIKIMTIHLADITTEGEFKFEMVELENEKHDPYRGTVKAVFGFRIHYNNEIKLNDANKILAKIRSGSPNS